MKTGRLLKFPRPQGDVHVYLYRDGAVFSAAVYLLSPGGRDTEPVHSASGPTEAAVEASVREWVESHYPRSR